ncbi:MAG: non-heme iron oxygenase ferredoxin subunit [Proteobacteria bacterium]|nr:non-heme iron oxygenase ferredoxin subunit [Pseudomonadota bacterium]
MTDWTRVCAVSELPNGSCKVVDIEDVMIAVFNLDGKYHAIEDICTHDGGELASGKVEGCEVICPRHGARFCIKTGKALTPPAYAAVDVFPLKIEEDSIWTRDDRWD